MSTEMNNGETIDSFFPFSSLEDSSISSSFPLIFKNEKAAGSIDEELEIDDSFFFYDPNNPLIFHDQGVTMISKEGAKHGEIRNHDEVLGTPTQFAFLTPCSAYEANELETVLKKEATEKFDDMDRILVDTAAPFESVREAVSKFGGIVDCKAEERLSIEKQKQIQLELKKVQEEVLKHRKRFQDEETAKAEVLEELDRCKGFVEELNHRLEREATLEKQAKQDRELADMRLREVEEGITDDSSVASKVQLDVANERHASAVVELKSVKEEFESIQTAYASLLPERDIAIEKAAASLAAFKEIKHTIRNLALKLIITKQLLESVCIVRLKSEEQILVAALELEIEKLVWDKLLEHAEEELQQVTEQIPMKLELDRTSTLVANLKTELALQNQAVSVLPHTEGFEKFNKGVSCLKIQLSSLLSELEREKASLSSMREREDLKSSSIASLESELDRMNTELKLVLKKVKIEATAKESESTRVDFFSNAAVRLTLEEHNGLREKVKELEKQAKETTVMATEQMEIARKGLEEKKKRLREAMARVEKVEEERLLMEQELRAYKEKHRHEPTTRVGSFDRSMDLGAAGETASSSGEAHGDSQCESSTRCTGGVVVGSDNKIVLKPKPKRRKRMFFARIIMFLARKKVQSLK